MADQASRTKPTPRSLYPDAKYGPLGEQHAHYADPVVYASKPEGNSHNRVIIGGIVAVLVGTAVVVVATVLLQKGAGL